MTRIHIPAFFSLTLLAVSCFGQVDSSTPGWFEFDVPGLGIIAASVLDMGNFCIFVRAADVGLDHEQDIVTCQSDTAVIARLEAIRKVVAAEMNYITGPDADEQLRLRMAPLLFAVGQPRPYRTLNGELIPPEQFDLFSRSITRGVYSKTHPGSGSIGTGVCAGIEGTITSEMAAGGPRPVGSNFQLRVGHPGGTLCVDARIGKNAEGSLRAERAVLGRTARVLMEGAALLSPGIWPEAH